MEQETSFKKEKVSGLKKKKQDFINVNY